MNDSKENNEPGDSDFERFVRENSHTCVPYPLIVLMEKIKAIQTMYTETLNSYIKLIGPDPEITGLKKKLLEYLEKYVAAACETFDQFSFLLIADEEDEDEGSLLNEQN